MTNGPLKPGSLRKSYLPKNRFLVDDPYQRRICQTTMTESFVRLVNDKTLSIFFEKAPSDP